MTQLRIASVPLLTECEPLERPGDWLCDKSWSALRQGLQLALSCNVRKFLLPAQDPVLKDQVLNCNITHSKHCHATRKEKQLF